MPIPSRGRVKTSAITSSAATRSTLRTGGHCRSLGPAFSLIEDNVIRDIHVRRRFSGAEMAGIKFHGAIDTVIRRNHIARTCRGLWLDWMAQGTRVSQNLFHENASEDLFVEVNHGPFVVDNNVFLSPVSVLDMSESGAYAHNLFGGKIINRPEPQRGTPYHPPHATVIAGLAVIQGGDNRFYNNLVRGGRRRKVPAPAQKSNCATCVGFPATVSGVTTVAYGRSMRAATFIGAEQSLRSPRRIPWCEPPSTPDYNGSNRDPGFTCAWSPIQPGAARKPPP